MTKKSGIEVYPQYRFFCLSNKVIQPSLSLSSFLSTNC